MNSRFQFQLFLTMLAFALTISFTIAIVDYNHIKNQSIYYHELELTQIEENVKLSIQSIDKALYLFDQDTAEKMKRYTYELLEKYNQNPNVDEWDFQEIKENYGMDVYMINEENVITHSSFEKDIGLDFNKCCKKLANEFNERREAGIFFHDGIDIEQETGKIKKYSVMATEDKKYLIELGYSIEDDKIFKEFNFLDSINQLIAKHDSINDIRVLNFGGIAYGEPAINKMSEKRRKAFDEVLKTGGGAQIIDNYNGEEAIFRYLFYESDYDDSPTKNRVIEIVYNDDRLQADLRENRKFLMIKLFTVFFSMLALSLIISKFISKLIHLAFHDNLTKLKNRAAFLEISSTLLTDKNKNIALFMIDLDNFKLVNDTLGHDEGDILLKRVAEQLLALTEKNGESFRLGGDEFVVLLPYEQKKDVEQFAHAIVSSIEQLSTCYKRKEIHVTASIGIALTSEDSEDLNELYKMADIALYKAKEKGKNQFAFYAGEDFNKNSGSIECSS